MWQDRLKAIIYILENSNVNEIEINFWGRKFRVVKSPSTVLNNELQKQNAASQPINISSLKDEEVPNSSSDSTEENINIEEILSPMPGTYYSSPSPDDPPFIIKGDKVKKGQVLCIIEAMKIMNEIESEFDGTIMKVKVNNGDPVEYNQPLFVIKSS